MRFAISAKEIAVFKNALYEAALSASMSVLTSNRLSEEEIKEQEGVIAIAIVRQRTRINSIS